MVENSNSPPAQAGPSDGAHWSTYLAIALVSCFMGLFSFYVAVFSINEFVIRLSIITSVVVFFASMVFVSHGKVGIAFLISSCNVLIFVGLGLTFHLGKSLIEDVLKVTSTIDNPFGANTALERAVREGLLRKATASDLSAWRDAYLTNKYTKKNLSVPDGEDAMIGTVEVSNAYVVLAKFDLPWGRSGTNRAVFFVPKGAPFPAGEIGLSAIYDFETLRATCTAARTGSISC